MARGRKWPLQGDSGRILELAYWSPADFISFGGTLLALLSVAMVAIYRPVGEIWGVGLAALWIVVGMSDFVDGRVAERYGGSRSGARVDELSDKIKVIPMLVLLAVIAPDKVSWAMVVILVVRDILVTRIRNRAAREGIAAVKSARKLGKVKTTLIFIGIVMAFAPFVDGMVSNAVLAAAAIVSIMSGLEIWARYKAWQNIELFVDRKAGNKGYGLLTFSHMRLMLKDVGWPNWLSFFRMAAGFTSCMVYCGQTFGARSNLIALILLAAGLLSDAFDGWVARVRHEATDFGRDFDPAADKAIQYFPMAGLVVHLLVGGVPGELLTWPVGLCLLVILLRDLILLGVWKYVGVSQRPSWVSKVRAVVLGAVGIEMAALLAGVTFGFLNFGWVVDTLYAAMVLSVVSAIVETVRLMRKKGPA